MKNGLTGLAVVIIPICILLNGCATADHNNPDTITQFSTIDAILAGVYDGEIECSELKDHGSLGIGTFNALDGELVMLDDTVYQVPASGNPIKASQEMKTPFASTVDFIPDSTVPLDRQMTLEEIKGRINELASNTNLPCAIRVEGRFSYVKTRSVPAQVKPYPPLVEVTKNQPVFERENVEGSLIGFRLPEFVKGINVTGYHLHFLSHDRKMGGHVLNAVLDSGTLEIDECHKLFLVLPESESGFSETDFSIDRTAELKEAEQE